jgi:hypothetical protein
MGVGDRCLMVDWVSIVMIMVLFAVNLDDWLIFRYGESNVGIFGRDEFLN